MRWRLSTWFGLIVGLLAASGALGQVNIYAELSDFGSLMRPKAGACRLFAGTDPCGGNVDSGNFLRIEPDGASYAEGDWVLAEMEGPGAIVCIWMTGKNADGKSPFLRGRLLVYVDDRDKPLIDAKLPAFFGNYSLFLPPLTYHSNGGFVSYMPIPYSKYCKVVVTDHGDAYAHRVNGCGDEIPHLYYQITCRSFPEGTDVLPFAHEPEPAAHNSLTDALSLWEAPGKSAPQIRGRGAEETRSDNVSLEPSESVTVIDEAGPAVITQLRIQLIPAMSATLSNVHMEMYWDEAEQPAVSCSLGSFFGVPVRPADFRGLTLGFVDGTGYCHFPLPFAKKARVVLRNGSDRQVNVIYSATLQPLRQAPPLRFHTYCSEELPAAEGIDVTVLPETAGRGHYLGCTAAVPRGGLEGNERIYVDGDRENFWEGTGTEDYFHGGWYFKGNAAGWPLHGCTILEEDLVCAYRLHLADLVPFAKSIEVRLQHGAHSDCCADYRTVAYYYLDRP